MNESTICEVFRLVGFQLSLTSVCASASMDLGFVRIGFEIM